MIFCTFTLWNSYFFCIAEVLHIPQCTADHNLTLLVLGTRNLETSLFPQSYAVKAFILLTFLTEIPIGFVLTTQQENMDFCSQQKSIE